MEDALVENVSENSMVMRGLLLVWLGEDLPPFSCDASLVKLVYTPVSFADTFILPLCIKHSPLVSLTTIPAVPFCIRSCDSSAWTTDGGVEGFLLVVDSTAGLDGAGEEGAMIVRCMW